MRRSERTPAHVSSGNHLCLTNPELRRAYVAKLKSLMREHPGLRVFSAAMNDGGNPTPCDCPRCTEFMNASSSSDLYFDSVNELADGVRPAFPRNFLWTLAYSFARRPLKKSKVRDNVIVMACLLKSDKVTLLETEGGRPFRNNALEAWARSCPNVHVWDYVDTGPPYPSLAPVYFRMQEQYRLCKRIGVTGVFAENRIASRDRYVLREFYPMLLWLFAKLTENPDRDVWALIRDFMCGYYGAAGPRLCAYVRRQRERLNSWPHRMVDLAFVNRMHALYDQAERAVQNDPVLLARVKDARIWADFTTLAFKNKLAAEFVHKGGRIEDYPYKSSALKERLVRRLRATKSPFWRAGYPVNYPRGPRVSLAEMTEKRVLHDPVHMGRKWDVYVSAKLDGPAYPYGRADRPNGAYIERLILVRVGD